MQAPRESSSSFFVVPKASRLRWLVYLRWLALSAVAIGLAVSQVAGLDWVSPRPIAVALVGGLLYNLAFLWRVRRLEDQPPRPATSDESAGGGPVDRELELQALADVGALTVLLSASGGLQNPICIFYGFHVVLGAMLGDRRGALLAASMAGLGIAVLALAQRGGHLLSRPLGSPPLWLTAGTALLSVICLAYFAVSVLRYVEREQGRAGHNYELLLSALDRLQVGLELVSADGRVLLANQRAAALRPSPTATGRWLPPSGLTAAVPKQPGDSARFAHTEGGETRIIELLMLSGGGGRGPQLRAYLYADRTEATVDEQRAIMLERLASLGRAMQDVAHELNTPLASIQTLAVDLSHTLAEAESLATVAASPDVAESVALIVDEARRCQQISRELLSTARLGSPSPVRTLLADVVRRATRLTYGKRRGLLRLHGDLDLACVTDGDRLLQILVNLLQNASDASDQPVDVLLQSSQRDGQAQAVIEVRDYGPGLPAPVAARLFVPFVSTKPPGQGTGLGLYTCARLAQQLHGHLLIENVHEGDAAGPVVGVRARLALPLDGPDASPETSSDSEPAALSQPTSLTTP